MSSQSDNPLKTEKEIKAEVLGILGTLKEKLEFVRKCSNKYLLSIFNTLYKDPNFKDGSGVEEYKIYQVILSRPECPKEIVLGCLAMPWFEGQDFAYRSKFVDTSLVDSVAKEVIKTVKTDRGLDQKELNLLTSILHSPKLSRTVRLRIENLCDKLSEAHADDGLISVAVKFTKRPAWLSKKFSQYLQGGSGDMKFINNVVENPLCKPFMVDYACRLCFNPTVANKLLLHPKISIQGLENLRSKFREMADYIDKIIEIQLDPED